MDLTGERSQKITPRTRACSGSFTIHAMRARSFSGAAGNGTPPTRASCPSGCRVRSGQR